MAGISLSVQKKRKILDILVHTWTSCMYCAHTHKQHRCAFSTMMATGHLLPIPKRGEQDRPACPADHQKKRKLVVMIVITPLPFLFLYRIVSPHFSLKKDKKNVSLPRSSVLSLCFRSTRLIHQSWLETGY